MIALCLAVGTVANAQNRRAQPTPEQAAHAWETSYYRAVSLYGSNNFTRAAAYFFASIRCATNRSPDEREHYAEMSLDALARCCVLAAADAPGQKAGGPWLETARQLGAKAEKLPDPVKQATTTSNQILNLAYCQLKLGQGLAETGRIQQGLPFLEAGVSNLASNHAPNSLLDNFFNSLDKITHYTTGSNELARVQSLLGAVRVAQKARLKETNPELFASHPQRPMTQAEMNDEQRRMDQAVAEAERKRRALEAAQAHAAAQGAQNGMDDLF